VIHHQRAFASEERHPWCSAVQFDYRHFASHHERNYVRQLAVANPAKSDLAQAAAFHHLRCSL